MANDLICAEQEESALSYGKYSQQSAVCPICSSSKANTINLMRANKHMSYKAIASEIGVTEKAVKKHFDQHFILSPACQKVISLKEHSNDEAKEIVRQILDEDIDIFSACKGVLKSKASRLMYIRSRIDKLQELYDQDLLDEDDSNFDDFFKMNKLAEDTENRILDTYKVLDQKLLPSKQDFSDAFLQFQLAYLKKMVDHIQAIFIKYSNVSPEYGQMIMQMRYDLAKQINMMEMEVVGSQNQKIIDAKTVQPEEEAEE